MQLSCVPSTYAQVKVTPECKSAVEAFNKENTRLGAILGYWNDKRGDWLNPKDKVAGCEGITWYLNVFSPFRIEETRKLEKICAGQKLRDVGSAQLESASQYWVEERLQFLEDQKRLCALASMKVPSTPAVPASLAPNYGPRATCSTITGGNLPPAPKGKCEHARKLLSEARTIRKGWFGSKAKAEGAYNTAAGAYREAGDAAKADLTIEESKAEDVTIYEQGERDAEQRPRNLDEAENQYGIARKIEAGAYESKSCADLKRAADYYFEVAKSYMRANEFAKFNAVALHRDELEALIDDAKRRGACDGKAALSRSPSSGSRTASSGGPTDDQCRNLRAHLDNKDLRNDSGVAAQRVLAVPMCRGIIKVSDNDCLRASIFWMDAMSEADKRRKLADAGCRLGG